SMLDVPPLSPPFPYTTLFRSDDGDGDGLLHLVTGHDPGPGFPARSLFHSSSRLPLFSRNRLLRQHSLGAGYIPTLDLQKVGILRSEEHTSELQSRENIVCRLL